MKSLLNTKSLLVTLSLALISFSLFIYGSRVVAQPPHDIPPGLEIAIEVQEAHNPNLLSTPNVVGTAIGLNKNGKPVIQVFTSEEGTRGIPRNIETIPVEVIVSGEFYAYPGPSVCMDKDEDGYDKATGKCSDPAGGEYDCNDNDASIYPGASEICGDLVDNDCDGVIDEGCGGGPDPTPTPTPTPDPVSDCNPTDRCDRPVPIGVSTGHPSITAGTIGCRVTDGTDVYALSNNHVYAASNAANLGDNVLQPGTYDGGSNPADAIGTLYDFVDIQFCNPYPSNCPNNTLDAAIAHTTTYKLGNSTTLAGYGTPRTSTINPSLRMNVMKFGRTTGLTTGKINGLNGTFYINYGSAGIAKFVNLFLIKGSFSAGGDSGSLIVVNGGGHDRKPVGLLFAGSSSDTLAMPINPVLQAFGVTIDGE